MSLCGHDNLLFDHEDLVNSLLEFSLDKLSLLGALVNSLLEALTGSLLLFLLFLKSFAEDAVVSALLPVCKLS
jgi:hypothetical protein